MSSNATAEPLEAQYFYQETSPLMEEEQILLVQ